MAPGADACPRRRRRRVPAPPLGPGPESCRALTRSRSATQSLSRVFGVSSVTDRPLLIRPLAIRPRIVPLPSLLVLASLIEPSLPAPLMSAPTGACLAASAASDAAARRGGRWGRAAAGRAGGRPRCRDSQAVSFGPFIYIVLLSPGSFQAGPSRDLCDKFISQNRRAHTPRRHSTTTIFRIVSAALCFCASKLPPVSQ